LSAKFNELYSATGRPSILDGHLKTGHTETSQNRP
jgi:hypothetical protein